MNNSSNQLKSNELEEKRLKKQIISMLALSSSSFSLSTSSVSSNQQVSSSSFFDSNSNSNSDSDLGANNNKLNSCSTESSQQIFDNKTDTSTSQSSKENNKYMFILNAFVNGFAQLKLCASKIDYEYIIEVYWSNGTKTFVKRTYDDFHLFHQNLMQQFGSLFNDLNKNNQDSKSAVKNGMLKQNQFLMPILPAAKKSFWMSHLKLAESREISLNNYVQQIIQLPMSISHSSLISRFFESQSSDPKPVELYQNNKSDKLILTENNYNFSSPNSIFSNYDSNLFQNKVDDQNININHINIEEEEFVGFDYYEDDTDFLNGFNLKNSNFYNNKDDVAGNREVGLWWDEDNSLNELTSFISPSKKLSNVPSRRVSVS